MITKSYSTVQLYGFDDQPFKNTPPSSPLLKIDMFFQSCKTSNWANRIELITWAESSSSSQVQPQESPLPSAFVGNRKDNVQEAPTGSEQGSSMLSSLVLNFNVLRRACNCQPPPPLVQKNMANFLVPPIIHVDTT